MIVAPPVPAGALKRRVSRALPAVAVTPVGESGVVRGVTAAEASEPRPAMFSAATVQEYELPLLIVETVIGLFVL